jgi:hypothetical protein
MIKVASGAERVDTDFYSVVTSSRFKEYLLNVNHNVFEAAFALLVIRTGESVHNIKLSKLQATTRFSCISLL